MRKALMDKQGDPKPEYIGPEKYIGPGIFFIFLNVVLILCVYISFKIESATGFLIFESQVNSVYVYVFYIFLTFAFLSFSILLLSFSYSIKQCFWNENRLTFTDFADFLC
jgi:hypothetical protein